ncbi:SDR family oxidoreductase [Calditrichota bacterium LG25]
MSLTGRIALVTGATSGIGKATAIALAREGASVILLGRRIERLEAVGEEIKKRFKANWIALPVDVRDFAAVQTAINGLPEFWQNIDILINNAGLAFGLSRLHEGEVEDWEAMIDTNVKGLLYVTRTVVPGMVKRGKGDVVNIGSIAGHEVYPGGNVYCATKHAVDALTKGLRIDLVDTPIRVSSVDPGLVETEFSVVRFKGDKEKAKNVYRGMQPLTGEDIAETIVFIVSRPPHVQIADVVIFPTAQASATIVHREENG